MEVNRTGENPVDDSLVPVAELSNGIVLATEMIEQKLAEQPVVLIAVVGGSATGKTSLVTPRLAEKFHDAKTLSEDNYCIGNSGSTALHGQPNLHVFADYDPARIFADLSALKSGQAVESPLYAFEQRERRPETATILPSRVIIMEGGYLLQPCVSDLFDVRLFVDTDDHSRFVRRMLRPRRNPNQSDLHRVQEYCEFSYPSYYSETAPYRSNAHLILTNNYTPAEAAGILGPDPIANNIPTAAPIVESFSYWHPNMNQGERVSLVITQDGYQVLSYFAGDGDGNDDSPLCASFTIHSDDYIVDLTRVGYRVAA